MQEEGHSVVRLFLGCCTGCYHIGTEGWPHFTTTVLNIEVRQKNQTSIMLIVTCLLQTRVRAYNQEYIGRLLIQPY